MLESGKSKVNDNCIMCSNGSYYNNGNADPEVWEEQEDMARCADLCSGKGNLRQQSGCQGLAALSGTLKPPFTG